jgi:hypothetical protein
VSSIGKEETTPLPLFFKKVDESNLKLRKGNTLSSTSLQNTSKDKSALHITHNEVLKFKTFLKWKRYQIIESNLSRSYSDLISLLTLIVMKSIMSLEVRLMFMTLKLGRIFLNLRIISSVLT